MADIQPQQPARTGEELKAQQRAASRKAVLEYHEFPTPGRISVTPTKPLSNQYDLVLAYSPSVAVTCEGIVENVANPFHCTARGNLVDVVTNGTAVPDLDDIGPEASKSVMEGKAGLFKKFVGIDVLNIEINERSPQRLVDIIAPLEPIFGGINLEDIKAPGCFFAKYELCKHMKIPVFHDDQHGTAIAMDMGITNTLKVVRKDIKKAKLVVSGVGTTALACLDLPADLGLPRENVWVADLVGVVYEDCTELMGPNKAHFAQKTNLRTLAKVIDGADTFLGLSAAGALKQDMVERMVGKPIIFALANPNPEILPEQAKEVRPDIIMGTDHTDYPNQVNSVLCFPFTSHDALDVGTTTIMYEMEVVVVHTVAGLARQEQSDIVAPVYGVQDLSFGSEYLVPKPFNPRLIIKITPVVAQVAMPSGMVQRPIEDMDAYCQYLQRFVYHSGTLMKPIFSVIRRAPMENKRVVLVEGEEEHVLRAVRTVTDEMFASPILIGRPSVIAHRIGRFGLRLREDVDLTVINPERDERFHDYWETYCKLMACKGVMPQYTKLETCCRNMLIGTLMIQGDEVDGMICGTVSNMAVHLRYTDQILGGTNCVCTAMSRLVLPGRQVFLTGTHVNVDPTAEQLVEVTIMVAEELCRFGIKPRTALMLHSNFGSSETPSAVRMHEMLMILHERTPNLEADGEMHGDAALDEGLRASLVPDSTLRGKANLLVMSNVDVANTAYNPLKAATGNNIATGLILLGVKESVHVFTPSAAVQRILNMTVSTVVDAAT